MFEPSEIFADKVKEELFLRSKAYVISYYLVGAVTASFLFLISLGESNGATAFAAVWFAFSFYQMRRKLRERAKWANTHKGFQFKLFIATIASDFAKKMLLLGALIYCTG